MKKVSPITIYNLIMAFIPLAVLSFLSNNIYLYLVSTLVIGIITYRNVRKIIFYKEVIIIRFIFSGKEIILTPNDIDKIEFKHISSQRNPPRIIIYPNYISSSNILKIFQLEKFSFYMSSSMKPYYIFISNKTTYFDKVKLNIDKKNVKNELVK